MLRCFVALTLPQEEFTFLLFGLVVVRVLISLNQIFVLSLGLAGFFLWRGFASDRTKMS